MSAIPVFSFTPYSIYCQEADVHIDPWQPVDKAIITHAHSDHARPGCKHYLAHTDSESILRLRLGEDISLQTVAYNEPFYMNGIKCSLHPAGHIIGSAQVRMEKAGEVWVAAGDYKLQDDKFCPPFEPVNCHYFVTESTFGLPVYHWKPQHEIMEEIKEWWRQNRLEGKTSVLMGYALGKMQRLIKNLQPFEGEVYAHGTIYNMNETLRKAGFDLPYLPLITADTDKKLFPGSLVFAPSSALNSSWMNKFKPFSTGYCSGWMAVRGAKNRTTVDRGFVLSDHADWNELNTAVKETQAEKVFVTHGYTDVFARWLNENGIEAAEVKTMYGGEEEMNTNPAEENNS